MTILKKEEVEPERELEYIRPSKVSLVDRGANGEFFFIAKSLTKVIAKAEEPPEEDEKPPEEDTLLTAVKTFLQSTFERVQASVEWLKDVEVDEESDVPQPFKRFLSRTTDSLQDVKDALTEDGEDDTLKISGAKRDKLVSVLDALSEKLAKAISKVDEDGEITEEFHAELSNIIDGFKTMACGDKEDEEKSESSASSEEDSQSEEDMTTKRIVTLIKSLEKSDLDVQNIKKQAGAASAKLEEIMSMVNVSSEDAQKMDFWDLRYKIGEAIGLLVDAAKLEGILGGGSAPSEEETMEEEEKQTPEDEETPPQEGDEEETEMSEEEKTKKSASGQAEGSTKKRADESSDLTDAIVKALAPISEKLDAIVEKVDSQDTRIEKMERSREPAKGGSPDNTEKTITKSEDGDGDNSSSDASDDGSVFSSIMPPQLRGRVRR